jgi:hypothetical protein
MALEINRDDAGGCRELNAVRDGFGQLAGDKRHLQKSWDESVRSDHRTTGIGRESKRRDSCESRRRYCSGVVGE